MLLMTNQQCETAAPVLHKVRMNGGHHVSTGDNDQNKGGAEFVADIVW